MNMQKELEEYKQQYLILEEEYYKLQNRCKRKQIIIDNNLAVKILESLSETNNLTETAKRFECSPEELYLSIPDWDGCKDRLYGLTDYLVYRNRLEGRCEELAILDKIEDKKMRKPDSDELDAIFTDYKKRKHSLYELADKYDLLIINLFRLLKEGGLIKSESDAFGYNEFYKEYIGEYSYNKYCINKNLKLIDLFYK
jgi:hypothetical protein